MGVDSYWHYVPYEEEANNALQKLREREFEAGRYEFNYSEKTGKLLNSSSDEGLLAPGKGHETMRDALIAAFGYLYEHLGYGKFKDGEYKDEYVGDGTKSILDLKEVSEDVGKSVAYILKKEELIKCCKTEKPTRDIIDKNMDEIWDYVDTIANGVRGAGICIKVYEDEKPSELFFMGFSWD